MRLADILKITLSPQTIADLAEANSFASMRKVVEASDRRCHEGSPFLDQAKFFASGTSNKWEGQLSDDDIGRYSDRVASLLPSDEAEWLNYGDQRRPNRA